MKNKKKMMIIFCYIILLLFLAGKIVITSLVNGAEKISIVNPNLLNISDGNYIGEYSITPVYVKVEVTVKNHAFTNINILKHNNGLGSTAENITSDIVETQSLNVDTVSGATISSKCILKAVENAIEKENKHE